MVYVHPDGRRAVPVADRPVDGDQAGAAAPGRAWRWAAGSCRPAIGNNLSGIFAGHVSGETGMTVESALAGYTFGFCAADRRRRRCCSWSRR